MSKKVFILNGSATSGKGTFVKMVDELGVPSVQYSYVDFTREMLNSVGIDIENKSEKLRKLMADINNSLEEFDDIPFKDCKMVYDDFIEDILEGEYLFIDCREPKKIERLKNAFNAETVFVKSDIENVMSNDADKKVILPYEYDYIIDNTGDFNDLRASTMEFLKKVCDVR